jgi:DNA adenine methylase
MTQALQPVIKWSGSKRALVPRIRSLLSGTGTYYEPFVGGGSVLGNVGPRNSLAGDTIPELIDLWRAIQLKPMDIAAAYERDWGLLQRIGHTHYYAVRDRFNQDRSPEDLLFLSRTCVNGLIRFNTSGNFNNSLHHTRPGIAPCRLRIILNQWSERIARTEFRCVDYEDLLRCALPGDIAYLDPPYMGTVGRYRPEPFDFDRLWQVLSELNSRGVRWVLSIDGTAGERDYSGGLSVVESISKTRLLLQSGTSTFPRVMNGRKDNVGESVFLNFDVES